jgi:hypothetical protein
MSDDTEARRQRAKRLRDQIADLTATRPAGSAPEAPAAAAPGGEAKRRPPRVHPDSPRSFVQQRMRELDAGKKKQG